MMQLNTIIIKIIIKNKNGIYLIINKLTTF